LHDHDNELYDAEKSITQLVMIEGNKDEGFIHLHDLLKEGIV
jgi:arabinose-5-phosphate isomerase